MLQCQDFKDLLSILAKHEVRYLVIGGYDKNFISREDLISVKLASGRDQDLKDVQSIKKRS